MIVQRRIGRAFVVALGCTLLVGVRLDAMVYVPSQEAGRYPTELIRSPYKNELDSRAAFLLKLLEQGYAIVLELPRK